MYQALYRKWRPQTFDEVVGQGHITETLKNQVINNRLSHAYLFIGTRGTGKTTCARILAKAANCENPVNGNPCCKCASCRGIADGSILDVVELDAASNNGVDNVRALREEAVFSPSGVRKRVYIIDEVHMLSNAAFNALLKILEEPPAHLMFILATTELHKVPATILSRCQRHSFRRIDAPIIGKYLEHIAKLENMRLAPEAAELIARLADGGVRDALSLLDQCSSAQNIDLDAVYSAMGLAGNRRTAQMLRDITDHNTPSVLKLFNEMWMAGKAPATLLGELSALLRDMLMLRVAPNGAGALISGGYDMTVLRELSERMTNEEIICAMETLQRAGARMRESVSPKTAAELCLVSLCDNTLGESLSELRARVSRLEENVASGALYAERKAPRTETRPVYDDGEEEADEECFNDEPAREEPEDFPTAEQFREVQPEDIYLPEPQTPAETQLQNASAPTLTWQTVRDKAAAVLPKTQSMLLPDERKVRGELDGNVLKIFAEPSFAYPSFNRQDILKKISEAASALAGRQINVQLSPLVEKPAPAGAKRDLEELRKYPEVIFNS